ncbi:hypothetical protein [Rhizobium brockwellii]|uniref:hypothetical protein n=1 Tax=Rhizobium brockwellii TaxID=3019932 RepID=UPI00293DBF8B|nr:hypothetical protein [Rhizobium brockwellii]MDV4155768.1 hypothetical protein [Rhizobium brockwellii]
MSFSLNSNAALDGSVTSKLVIATSDHKSPGNPLCAFAVRLLSKFNEEIGYGESGQERLEGDHTKAFFPAVIEVLQKLPLGSKVEVISNLSYVISELCRPASERRATCYSTRNGKDLLGDHAAYRQIDEIVEARSLTLSARRPLDYEERRHYKEVHELAHNLAARLSPVGAVS